MCHRRLPLKRSPSRRKIGAWLGRLTHQANAKRRDLVGYVVGRLRAFSPEDALVILAEPRGGSTWLAQVINTIPDTAVLWEPIAHARAFRRLSFASRQFIPRYADWPAAKSAFDRIFRGRTVNHCTCRLSSPMSFLDADKLVVKFCRANALAPWITRVFNFHYTPVLLLRHPFAVAASQLRHPAWADQPSQYTIQSGRYRLHHEKHASFLSTLDTKAEMLVATWCLSNLVPLRTPLTDRSWMTVHYEDLLLDPAQEIGRIFDAWDLPVPERALYQASIPSVTTQNPTPRKSGVDRQLTKWRSRFAESEIEGLKRVLDHFEIHVYSTALMPHRQLE